MPLWRGKQKAQPEFGPKRRRCAEASARIMQTCFLTECGLWEPKGNQLAEGETTCASTLDANDVQGSKTRVDVNRVKPGSFDRENT
jgi:hypothetical protein